MKLSLFWIGNLVFFLSCQPPAVVKRDYDFSHIKRVAVTPVKDHFSYPGSGESITRSLIHNLMKINLEVVERNKIPSLMDESILSQSAFSTDEYQLSLSTVDALIVCDITEFSQGESIIIPVILKNKGKTTIETTTSEKPVTFKNEKGEEEIRYESSVSEEKVHDRGSITETQQIRYIPSKVGITIQLVDKKSGDVLWSNNYWYNSLNLAKTIDFCIAGSLRPLSRIINN